MAVSKALALAAQGFYVFPIVEGVKAPPRMEGWQRYATRDTNKILDLWRAHPKDNIGISTSKFGNGEALLVLDVDNKGDKRGDDELLRLELEGRDLPDTYTQRTPTGGKHLVYRVPTPVRQSAGRLGDGLDVRSRGGYIVAAGSRVDAGEYSGEVREVLTAPAWLIELCGKPRERSEAAATRPALEAPSAEARAVHYLTNEAPLAVEGQAGDETTYKVAARLKDFGLAQDMAARLMLEHWDARCSPPWGEEGIDAKVRNAYAYGNEAPGSAAPEADFKPVNVAPPGKDSPVIDIRESDPAVLHPFDKLNATYAFVVAGGGSHILFETTDHTGRYKLEHLAPGTFHTKHAAEIMQVGKRSSPITEEWLRWKGRRSYDGLVFMPGLQAPERFYNLWKGFSVEPSNLKDGGKHPAVDAFLDHIKANVCGGDAELARWLIGFFAHMVQKPWDKPLVALVFRGGKGVGKGVVVRTIGALLGGHALLTSNRRYLIGNFNGHLENLLLFTLDEAFWSGDKQAEGQLKDLITGDHHVIEHKGKEPYTVENRTRIAIIGNEEWLVPASHDERRFAVLDVGDGRKQDRGFFQSMREGMEAGGYGVLLRYLLDFDVRGLDFNGAPITQGLADQKHATLEPFPAWWFTCLHDGKLVGGDFESTWPKEAEKERFRNAFRRYAKDRNVRGWIPDDRAVGRMLKQFAPHVLPGRTSNGHTYRMPELDVARADWSEYIGHAVTWE